MKNNKLQLAVTVLFFGSIWGIAEATIGYLLHSLQISILWSGTLMFPFVAYVLLKAYAVTKSKVSIFYIGIVAALIKSVNLLLPFGSVFKVINPMISIVLESLLVLAVINMFNKGDLKNKLLALPLASIGWRALYLGYMGVQYLATGYLYQSLSSVYGVIEFTLIYGVISGLIINAVIMLESYLSSKSSRKLTFKVTPLYTIVSLVIAVVLTIYL